MRQKVTVRLDGPAQEMAQEEIHKQVAYLAKDISQVRFSEDGSQIELEAPADAPADLAGRVKALAQRVQRSLRSLRRKVAYRSPAMDRPILRGTGPITGAHFLGNGQVALAGLPLRLFRYFERVFSAFGSPWNAEPLLTPTLIPTRALAKCDYFRSFPQNVTFACHLFEQAERIESFRARHHDRDDLDERALADMESPEACLSPAVCYHVYHLHQDQTVPAAGLAYAVGGKCFRYEASNLCDMRRLWDFTMREVVFLGTQEDVLARREMGIERAARFLEEHALAGEIRTASDPFFSVTAPDALAKTYFQLSSETKYEIALLLPEGGRLAVGSLNYHTDFFGRAFNVAVAGAGPMHSVCIGFGLERWVHAFLAQHGEDMAHWPAVVRTAPELAEESRIAA
jgi:seryl-tRNA synthetase